MKLLILPMLFSLASWTDEAPKGKLPGDASKLIEVFDQKARKIQNDADAKIQVCRDELVKELQSLQDTHTRTAMLDEAVAVRDKIRELKSVSQMQKVIEVRSGSRWYPAEILHAMGSQTYIRYIGYRDSYNEWVKPDRVRFSSHRKETEPKTEGGKQTSRTHPAVEARATVIR